MSNSYLFTSESVSEGHPDKVADQISDAVLDAMLAQDKRARVACETLVKTGVAIVAGEVTTEAWVDLEEIVRGVIVDIGYTSSNVGFDGRIGKAVASDGKTAPEMSGYGQYDVDQRFSISAWFRPDCTTCSVTAISKI